MRASLRGPADLRCGFLRRRLCGTTVGDMPRTVVCGVDGSPESLEAARQADVLLEPGGKLVLVSAVDLSDAIHFQVAPTAVHAARHALDVSLLGELDQADLMQPRRTGLPGREVSGLILGDPVEHGVPLALIHGICKAGNNITSQTIIASQANLPSPG